MILSKKEYLSNYRKINKEIINNKKKIYRLLNKNKILEYKKSKKMCCCGLMITNNSYNKHIKGSRHIKYLNKIVNSFLN